MRLFSIECGSFVVMVGRRSTYILEVTLVVLSVDVARRAGCVHKALSLLIVVEFVVGKAEEVLAI